MRCLRGSKWDALARRAAQAGPPQPPARRCGSPRRADRPLVVDGAQSIQRRSRSHQTAAGMARCPSVTAPAAGNVAGARMTGELGNQVRVDEPQGHLTPVPGELLVESMRLSHLSRTLAGCQVGLTHPCPPCDRVKVLSMVSGRARSPRGTPATREWNQSAGLGVVCPPRTAAASAPPAGRRACARASLAHRPAKDSTGITLATPSPRVVGRAARLPAARVGLPSPGV